MPLILELLSYFAIGFVGATGYQIGVKKQPLAKALHLAAIFGMAFMLILFIALLVLDLLGG